MMLIHDIHVFEYCGLKRMCLILAVLSATKEVARERPEKFALKRDSNPHLCQFSYQANWAEQFRYLQLQSVFAALEDETTWATLVRACSTLQLKI